MLCEDVVQMIALHIPEEDRCIDIYELIENEKMLSFHVQVRMRENIAISNLYL